jgi:hypothetical protein
MLLLFDEITFLEPVDDDKWRAKLMEDMVDEIDPRFTTYKDLYKPMSELKDDGVINVIDPKLFNNKHGHVVSSSALSDLMDESWTNFASAPQNQDMPHIKLGNDSVPSWQLFKPKIPEKFIEVISSNRNFEKHLISSGGEYSSWSFSYEAGSAIAIALHLAAAEEMCLAPVTDSTMHHKLMLRKSMRSYYNDRTEEVALTESTINQISNNAAVSLIKEFLPKEHLHSIKIEEILKFREATKDYRTDFVKCLNDKLSVKKSDISLENLELVQRELQLSIKADLKAFSNEINNAKAKVWPSLVSTLNLGLASGGVSAVTFNAIGGAGYTLVGSILASSLALLKGGLDLRNEMEKAKRSASPASAFLSKVSKIR